MPSVDLTGDLFAAPPRARRSDPATSHAAAAKVQEFAPSHNGVIVNALKRFGPMTIDEIAEKTGLEKHAVARRLPELERVNAVSPTGDTRPGASGRQQRVWRVV